MANIYDQIISGSFDALGPAASSGWTNTPTNQPGMYGRGLPSDRLQPSPAGLPNPSPGSGITYADLKAQGGWNVDPQTGALAYSAPAPSNPAASAAANLATGVSLPRPRPGYAPTSIDMAAINGGGMNKVTGAMKSSMGQGGLLSLLMGPSKNGMGGLAGLLGGPQQGGILQALFGQQRAKASMPAASVQSPAQAYADRNSFARMAAIENSGLSQESKDRAARNMSGGDAHGLTANGNPGFWGS